MFSEFGIAKRMWSRWTALVLVASFTACVDDTVTPAPEQPTAPAQPRVLGFVELTFSGIGTSELSSSMITAPTLEALQQLRAERERSGKLRDLTTQDLTFPDSSTGGGNGTIQISKDVGDQFAFEGVRYLRSTFFVRNAMVGGAAYDTERTNLTFLAVSTNNTINQTAVSKLNLAGGTPAPPALALQVLPTDLMEQVGPTVSAAHPDVLQIFRESEIAAVAAAAPPGVTSVFPYGFVVRRVGPAGATTRTLPASPAESEFDGVVDFAFSIPQQPSPADDPQQLSVLLLAVDDSETQVTQGLQEQGDTADIRALRQLAAGLGADTVTLLPGGTLAGVSGRRTLCSVRTAGSPGSATAHLVNVDWTFQSFNPAPASLVQANAAFQATFSAPVVGAGPGNFRLRGLQSGPAFVGQAYSGNGTPTITTPNGNFFAGEEVEVGLTNAVACPQPQMARFRVHAAGTGIFDPDSSYNVGTNPRWVAIGDLDGINGPDLAVANFVSNDVSVLLNDGNGTFSSPNPPHPVGTTATSVAIGDLDGNGSLDLAVYSFGSGEVSVLLNTGNGTFPQQSPTYAVGAGDTNDTEVAIGDLNGDGSLDLAIANGSSNIPVLLNNGDGTFQAGPTYPAGASASSLVIGDLNGDASLDLAVANQGSADVSVLLNNGDGTFPAAQNPTYPVGTEPTQVVIGDLDGINGLDLATVNLGSNDVSVLLNNGNGTFPAQNPSYPIGTNTQSFSLAIGNLDDNDSLDLVTTNAGSLDVSVFLNNGNGTFPTPNPTYPAGPLPQFIAISDLNGNGSLDLVIANFFTTTITVLAGQVP